MENLISKQSIKEEILAGKIFIYPTDTIYGIGCDATNLDSVNKIKELKARDKDKPLSVIAPSVNWIKENFIIDVDLKKYLPGAYTIILKRKNPEFLKWISSNDSIGIRIPKSSFTKKIQEAKVPFVTTSVNLSGEPFALTLEDIPEKIKQKVDYIISIDSNEKLSGKPSTLIINGKEIERK